MATAPSVRHVGLGASGRTSMSSLGQSSRNTTKPLLDEESAEESKPRRPVDIRRLLYEAYPERFRLIAGTIALFLGAVATLSIPFLFGRIIDALTNAKHGHEGLVENSIALAVAVATGSIFSFIRAYLFNSSGQMVVARLRRRVFESVLRMEMGFFDSTRTGELVSRLASDTAILKDAVTTNISMALRWGATVIGGLIYLFVVSWRLSLVMLALIPAIAICARLYGGYVRKLSKKQQEALAEASTVVEETFSGIRTVRSNAAEGRQLRTYASSIEKTLELGITTACAFGAFISVTTLLAGLAFCGIIYYGGTLVISGQMSVGDLTSFLLYAITIAGALGGLAGIFGTLMQAVGANERVYDLLDRLPLIPQTIADEPLENGVLERVQPPEGKESLVGDIQLEGVSFSYPSRKDTPVLNGLSLGVAAGEVVALVGPSGGGKSTIMGLIERFYDVDAGVVMLDGRDVRTYDAAWVRRQIGFVAQEPNLFAVSIEDNIRYGRLDATREEVIAAAQEANAHDFIMSFQDGYDTLVGERGVRLSGGQKQRVAIARAVLKNPRVLLLDEATSALDAESEYLVHAAIERLMVGKTVLIIAHRLSTVLNADRVCVVQNGQIVAQGTHTELVESSPVYAQLVRRQLTSGASEQEVVLDEK